MLHILVSHITCS